MSSVFVIKSFCDMFNVVSVTGMKWSTKIRRGVFFLFFFNIQEFTQETLLRKLHHHREHIKLYTATAYTDMTQQSWFQDADLMAGLTW